MATAAEWAARGKSSRPTGRLVPQPGRHRRSAMVERRGMECSDDRMTVCWPRGMFRADHRRRGEIDGRDEARAASEGLLAAPDTTDNPATACFALLAHGMAYHDADPVAAYNVLRRALTVARESGNRQMESAAAVTLWGQRPHHGRRPEHQARPPSPRQHRHRRHRGHPSARHARRRRDRRTSTTKPQTHHPISRHRRRSQQPKPSSISRRQSVKNFLSPYPDISEAP